MERRPPPKPKAVDPREVDHLRTQLSRLKAESAKYRKLQQSLRHAPAARKARPAPKPFELVDPRAVPVVGTKVLPPLTPPLSTARAMAAAVVAALREMTIETRALVKALAKEPVTKAAMDAVPQDAQHKIRELQRKWHAHFSNLAEKWTPPMIADVIQQSTAQLSMGLKDVADRVAIQATIGTPRMRAIVEASAQNSVGLIVRIPQRYLEDVQAKVMNAITTGSGLDKLVPYLTKRYQGDARHAKFVALDQVRKVSENVNATRVQELGSEEFVWIHVGGERYPRKLHQSYNRKTFRYDDLPIIDERTGERGKPGDAINCHCRQRPVFNFARARAP